MITIYVEQALRRLRLINAGKQRCDDDFVKNLLDHHDPIIKQWAISASRRVKDQEFIFKKLLQIMNEDSYYDVRIYALLYLTKMNYKISYNMVDYLLSQAVTAKQKAIVYKSLARSLPTIESLSYLSEHIRKEIDVEIKQIIEMNGLRIAKNGLINNSIDKKELKNKFPEIYERTKERRIEQEIQEKIIEKKQAQLFEINLVDLSDTPEKPMHDIEKENYINDLQESRNIEYISKRVYSRDIKTAKQYIEKIQNCEICGIDNIPFHVHHIVPLKDNGKDEKINMIGICPNCHSRFHNHQIKKIQSDLYELKNSENKTIILDIKLNRFERFMIYSNHFYNDLLQKIKF